jgi:RNA polymerase sigma-70 factor, ECF subfamily
MATTIWDGSSSAVHRAGDATDDLGEEDLQEALDQHWDRVCRTLYGLVGDWDEAEDLALEVFYRLHKRPPQQKDALRGWLYRVATHLGLNAIRARKRRVQYEVTAGALKLDHDAPVDPAVEVEARQAQQQVRHVLRSMRPRSAKLLLLRYLGLSYADLAREMDVAPGSVGTLLARAEAEFERRYVALEDRDATRE